MYRIENSGEKAEVYLYGNIGVNYWGVGNSAKKFCDELAELSPKPLSIHINSGGGQVYEAFAICSAIQRYEGETTAYVEGLAASAASYIAVVCDRVVMSSFAYLMIHKASLSTWGNADVLEKDAARLRSTDATLAAIYAARSSLTEEEALEAMAKETWYTAQEALDIGLATEIEETDERATAMLDSETAAMYSHVPAGVIVGEAAGRTCETDAVPSAENIPEAEKSHAGDKLEEAGGGSSRTATYRAFAGRVYKED